MISNQDKTVIAREVRHKLFTLPYYGVFDSISFHVDIDGTVTLFRRVVMPAFKDDAEGAAKHTGSATRFKNEIEVISPSPWGDRIRRTVSRPSMTTPY